MCGRVSSFFAGLTNTGSLGANFSGLPWIMIPVYDVGSYEKSNLCDEKSIMITIVITNLFLLVELENSCMILFFFRGRHWPWFPIMTFE